MLFLINCYPGWVNRFVCSNATADKSNRFQPTIINDYVFKQFNIVIESWITENETEKQKWWWRCSVWYVRACVLLRSIKLQSYSTNFALRENEEQNSRRFSPHQTEQASSGFFSPWTCIVPSFSCLSFIRSFPKNLLM